MRPSISSTKRARPPKVELRSAAISPKNRLVPTATRPVSGQCVRELYAFEIPSSTDWASGALQPAFRPNVFVDVTETVEVKINAMAWYETKSREFPHPRSSVALRAPAQRWGSVVGCQAAEAFELVRLVR